MTVFVDSARIPFRGMLMSHMWADSLDELLTMVDRIGVQRKWLQKPPKASWVHFDISEGKRRLAIVYGAIETDKYGPLEHEAREHIASGKVERVARGNQLLQSIAERRREQSLPAPAPIEKQQELF